MLNDVYNLFSKLSAYIRNCIADKYCNISRQAYQWNYWMRTHTLQFTIFRTTIIQTNISSSIYRLYSVPLSMNLAKLFLNYWLDYTNRIWSNLWFESFWTVCGFFVKSFVDSLWQKQNSSSESFAKFRKTVTMFTITVSIVKFVNLKCPWT